MSCFYRVSDETMEYEQMNENLKLKLSLRKKIWMGNSSFAQQPIDRCQQPLSLGMPLLARKKNPIYDEYEELLM